MSADAGRQYAANLPDQVRLILRSVADEFPAGPVCPFRSFLKIPRALPVETERSRPESPLAQVGSTRC
jgi:hypothetical protein